MANVRSGNTFYIDTQHSVAADGITQAGLKLRKILVTATAAPGRIVLQDITTGITKFDLRVSAANTTQEFIFDDMSITFPTGLKASTLSQAVATLIIDEMRT